LPPNKQLHFALTADFVEMLHDEIVPTYWPGSSPVQKHTIRDRGLLESACARPFQTAFGEEGFPSVLQKAAVLFHGLIANHAFHDGNKRTAVVALNTFLTANDFMLGLLPNDMYDVAIRTAEARSLGVRVEETLSELGRVLKEWAVPFEALRNDPEFAELYQLQIEGRKTIREHKLNRS
jgi:death-on-curing family protein